MKIKVIWVGKTKEPFVREGVKKYLRLLGHYAETGVVEIKEEKGQDLQKMIHREGERISKLNLSYVLLDEKGKNLTSPEFARFIEGRKSDLNFVLGGAFGTSEDVKKEAAEIISLSRMTLTHEMARLFLLEQIYRAFTIIKKQRYHH